ncbi:fasciclin [Aliidiomarina taiwanensis]|uniref:Fasciclin n=1 Tax=Aliidiomarina taiwanensis TaxID=946228 RepID=A0A432X164_9GAMM|nr:fasciclin domain-containing protein [Aliidiomarina taiwanensis]RUO39843.1 fasciclin [Aliidiomarina taiwanensis]
MKHVTLTSVAIAVSLFATGVHAATDALPQEAVVEAQAMPEQSANEQATLGTIADITSQESTFATLVKALEAVQLDSLLADGGPYTVFAPSNNAFDALPEGTLEYLLDPANAEDLKAVLAYHIVDESLTSTELTETQKQQPTVEGTELTITPSEHGVQVNEANIVAADIQASNGVIHIIDSVLIPAELANVVEVALNSQ